MKKKQNSSVYSSFIDLFKFSKKNNKDNVEDLKENKIKFLETMNKELQDNLNKL